LGFNIHLLAQFLPMQIWNRYQFTEGNTALKKEKHMSLVQTYLENNGYDYYGNAAEDTLVFFVRDENAPSAEEPGCKSDRANPNLSHNTVNGLSIDLTSEVLATNK